MNTRERYQRNVAIVEAFNAGRRAEDIANEWGVTTATVYTVVREARLDGIDIPARPKGRTAAYTERDARIVERFKDGETMEAIGKDYGITRERVRQIVQDAGVPSIGRSALAYRRWAEQHGDAVNAAFTQHRSIAAVVEDFPEAPHAWVRRFLRPRAHESIHGRTPATKTWTDEQIFDALRLASTDGVVTTTMYGKWRRNGGLVDGRVPPTTTLITWRFGSWKNAVVAADLRTGKTSRTTYTRQWTEADALRAVRLFVADAHARGLRPTYVRYDAWLAEHPGHPSGAYLRHLTSMSWSEILLAAVESKDEVAA